MTINSFNRGRSLSRITRGVTGLSNVTATGGIISDYDDGSGNKYRAHIFTSTGNLNVTDVSGIVAGTLSYNPSRDRKIGQTVSANTDYLVVAGGGGGANPSQGQNRIAGSGAGGFITGPTPVSATSYPISVGAGGAGNGPVSNNGANTTAFSQTAYGGGGAGHSDPAPPSNGFPGGSGGGGWYTAGGAGGSGFNYPGPTQQGYPGSPGFNTPEYGGGGGGAGGAGQRRFGGAGAPNVYAYGPTNPVTYAAGGESSDYPGTDRTANGTFSTGNGGSGRGSGGSGIVVVRYQIGQLTATAKATGGAISYYNGKTIHTFTSSGTFQTLSNWSPTNVEYVVVGGGGAGNGGGDISSNPSGGGGGGAGGFITNTNHPIGSHPVSVTVTIGAGGAGQYNSRNPGSPSSFGSPLTAYGGGGAGRHINGGPSPTENGDPGGSGGGANDGGGTAGSGDRQTGTSTPAPITPQGFPGGAGAGSGGFNGISGGGGGGAGQAGQNAVDQGTAGTGGYGKQLPATFQNPLSATSLGSPATGYAGSRTGDFWFAGGGGGGGGNPPYGTVLGGAGGGGSGYNNPNAGMPGPRVVMNAVQSTGGGGGGFHGPGIPGVTGGDAGSGGSGIVLIAYPS